MKLSMQLDLEGRRQNTLLCLLDAIIIRFIQALLSNIVLHESFCGTELQITVFRHKQQLFV